MFSRLKLNMRWTGCFRYVASYFNLSCSSWCIKIIQNCQLSHLFRESEETHKYIACAKCEFVECRRI